MLNALSGLPSFALRRIAGAAVTTLAACILVFLFLALVPGDPATIIAGDTATEAAKAAIRTELGLDLPLTDRLRTWLVLLAHGDLGSSLYSHAPVVTLISQRLEPTLALASMALVWALAIGLTTGILTAWYAEGNIDRVWMMITAAAYSMPVFFIGYLLSFALSVRLGLFPVQGFKPVGNAPLEALHHLILPGIAASLPIACLLSRVTRSSFLEVLREDFVRTARAKGVRPVGLLLHHCARNAALPIVTTIGSTLAILIEGAVFAEVVFNIPGIGSLTADAIRNRDYPVIQGLLVVFAVVHVGVNLLVDVTYSLIDPRIALR
ncbi:ABC transporter permease [Bradyrhizobium sp. USDA 336]|uniref:ABC transporter permease n=1 Tax=Bradyrhizobium sp. USDA 336 TaxID=3156311 RepID=UPI0038384F8F